jgi:haloacetate dehalogenase
LFSKEQSRERWYFFFHQIAELPEKLVSGKERIYLEHFYKHWSYCSDWLTEQDLDAYTRAFSTPGALRGGFNHYRAALSVDVDQWKRDEGRQINTPTLVLWGKDDPVSPPAWTTGFDRVFTNLDLFLYSQCGHFIAEEQPQAAADDILRFAQKLAARSK